MDSTDSKQISDALSHVFRVVEERFGTRLLDSTVFRGELTFTVAADDLVEVARFCKESPELSFERLDCLIGNNFPERRDAPFEVVLHLTSVSKNVRMRLKTPLADGQPCPTLTGVWLSAGWDERETHEMYGIVFEGNPDLRRLLTLPDFEGYPLRKDFPIRGLHGGRIRTDLKGKL